MTAVAQWPSELPSLPQRAGWGYTDGENVIRTDMDAGPPKRRRRSTDAVDSQAVALNLTTAQRDVLHSWYKLVLLDGSLEFSWTSPLTGLPVTMAFTSTITWACLGANAWSASFELVILP